MQRTADDGEDQHAEEDVDAAAEPSCRESSPVARESPLPFVEAPSPNLRRVAAAHRRLHPLLVRSKPIKSSALEGAHRPPLEPARVVGWMTPWPRSGPSRSRRDPRVRGHLNNCP